MKKILLILLLLSLSMAVFGQIPCVFVEKFTSKARDIDNEDIFIVSEMFEEALTFERKVKVVDEPENADYIITGSLTQLGTSITFNIFANDLKSSAVIAAAKRQYNLSDIWNNSDGIPGQLSDMANEISNGISDKHNQLQNEKKAEQKKIEQPNNAHIELSP